MSPKGVYPHTHIKPRVYSIEIIALVRRLYLDEGMTVREVQDQLPKGYKAQRIIERHIPKRRPTAKRDQRGENNTSWRGDDLGYDGAHERVKSVKGKASDHECQDCYFPACDWSYIGGCPSEKVDPENGCAYSPNPEMYEPRCRSCHWAYDCRARTSDGRYAPRGGDANVC